MLKAKPILKHAFALHFLVMIALFLGGCDLIPGAEDEPNEITLEEKNDTFTITYAAPDASSGTVPVDTTEYNSGDTATIIGNTGNLKRDGYNYASWITQSSGEEVSLHSGDTYTVTNNKTLYAQWNETIETTFRARNVETNTWYDLTAFRLAEGEYGKIYVEEGSDIDKELALTIAQEFDTRIYTQIIEAFGTHAA